MSDGTTAATAADAATPAQVAAVTNAVAQAAAAPAAQAPPATQSAPVGLNSEQLATRLEETRKAEQARVLKELGLSSLADGKKSFETLKALQQANLSEQEKVAASLKEAEARAAEGSTFKKLFSGVVEAQFAALPKNVQDVIDAQAAGDPVMRFNLMEIAKALAPATPATAASPAVAAPPPLANQGNTPPAPQPAPVRSKLDEFNDLQRTRPQAAGLFYSLHRTEIEAARAAQNK